MDIGVVIALWGFGLTALFAVLMGIIAAIAAVAGTAASPHQDED